MTNQVQAEENAHLQSVLDQLAAAKADTQTQITRTNSNLADAKAGWNEVKIKADSYSGLMETAMSVRQQQQLLAQRESAKSSAEKRLETIGKLQARPYFARLDFTDTTDGADESIYIGLASFSDEDGNFLTIDWRAPIASVYYDGGLGKVTYDTPDGQQVADVTLKRQFQIEDGVIVTLFDTEEAVGDAMLLNALSGESSTKMKSIVTTIQRAQNKIIRNTQADLLFVQGAAGSGKTAAVLQRVAYLLYRYRGKLTSGQVVMFSPNQLFNDYVNEVLPELGEQNMVQLTFYQYANRRLARLDVETLQERFETPQTPAQQAINIAKGSLAAFKAVGQYAQSLNQGGMQFKAIKFRGEELFSAQYIADIYYSYNETYKLGQRLDATIERLIRGLQGKVSAELQADWVEEAIENLSKQDYDALVGATSARNVVDEDDSSAMANTQRAHGVNQEGRMREFKDDAAERRFLAKQIVNQAFRPIAKRIRRASFLNANAQFVQFLKAAPALFETGVSADDWKAGIAATIADIKAGKMSLADTTMYLYLYDLLKGSFGERDIRFLFIDEIQDYTPFQLAFLKFAFPRAKFTVLGDLNQAIFTQRTANSLQADFASLFDPERVELVQLTQTYRSTQQITDFTKAILTDGAQIDAFDRQGAKPLIVKTTPATQVDALVAHLTDDGETTAIITKTAAEAAQLAEALQSRHVAATLIQSENQRLALGTLIVPSYLAKGLEFDAVVIWDASAQAFGDENERQLLYTIASRAMHRLTILMPGEPSPLLANVSEDLYDVE
ncbi:MAG TPA: RNA polymerase recycling motor HelD [Lactobacillaceae bacterium]|jgi:DNA helicase-2/ATP-dependent DNA helicase PcrA